MRIVETIGLAALRWSYRLEQAAPALIDARSLRELSAAAFAREAPDWIACAESGLDRAEKLLIDRLAPRPGKALCLASGAGREAFALARSGFSVVGVEQSAEMVRFGRERAAAAGLPARFILGDMTRVDLAEERFDVILMLNLAYSLVPARRERTALLARLRSRLSPNGRCVLSFAVKTPSRLERAAFPLLKAAAVFSGNPGYELGDRVDAKPTFFRLFPSPETVAGEAREAGFRRVEHFAPTSFDRFAVLAP